MFEERSNKIKYNNRKSIPEELPLDPKKRRNKNIGLSLSYCFIY